MPVHEHSVQLEQLHKYYKEELEKQLGVQKQQFEQQLSLNKKEIQGTGWRFNSHNYNIYASEILLFT